MLKKLVNWFGTGYRRYKVSLFYYRYLRLKQRYRIGTKLAEVKEYSSLEEMERLIPMIDEALFKGQHAIVYFLKEEDCVVLHRSLSELMEAMWSYIVVLNDDGLIKPFTGEKHEVSFKDYLSIEKGMYIDSATNVHDFKESSRVFLQNVRRLESRSYPLDKRNLALLKETLDELLIILRRLASFQI